jgi:hypothetical protein
MDCTRRLISFITGSSSDPDPASKYSLISSPSPSSDSSPSPSSDSSPSPSSDSSSDSSFSSSPKSSPEPNLRSIFRVHTDPTRYTQSQEDRGRGAAFNSSNTRRAEFSFLPKEGEDTDNSCRVNRLMHRRFSANNSR